MRNHGYRSNFLEETVLTLTANIVAFLVVFLLENMKYMKSAASNSHFCQSRMLQLSLVMKH